MSKTSLPILENPQGPHTSATYLVRNSKLPTLLRDQMIPVLTRWLAAQPKCRQPVKTLDEKACEAAVKAFRSKEPVEHFRLARETTNAVKRDLKFLCVATRHADHHPDKNVQNTADKALRALRNGRATWEQTSELLSKMRSLVRTSGVRRSRSTPVQLEEIIPAASGKSWSNVTTVEHLEATGHYGFCTGPSHPQSKDYARDLKQNNKRFYKLLSENHTLLGLVSIDVASNTVDEARAPRNKLLKGHYNSLKKLLLATGARVGDCSDLISLGLADEFLDINRKKPERECAGFDLWERQGNLLVRQDDKWALFREIGTGVFISHGEHDADNWLGMVFKAILSKRAL